MLAKWPPLVGSFHPTIKTGRASEPTEYITRI